MYVVKQKFKCNYHCTACSPWAGYAHRAPPPPPGTSLTSIFLFIRVSWIGKKMLREKILGCTLC